MISPEKMTIKRAFLFLAITLFFTYTAWGMVAINPGGWLVPGNPLMIVFYMAGGLSPTVTMLVLIKKWGRTKEERACIKPLFHTAHGWKQALFVTIVFGSIFLMIAMMTTERIEPWYMLAVQFPVMIVGGGLEEIGWRGFFQPALEQKLPFAVAAPMVGVIWSFWHIPLWFIPTSDQSEMNFIIFIIYCILLSYIQGALKRLTGSVAACISFHAWANVLTAVFLFTPAFSGEGTLLLPALMALFAAFSVVSAKIK